MYLSDAVRVSFGGPVLPVQMGGVLLALTDEAGVVSATVWVETLIVTAAPGSDDTHAPTHTPWRWETTRLVGHRGVGAEGAARTADGMRRTHVRENTILSLATADQLGVPAVEFGMSSPGAHSECESERQTESKEEGERGYACICVHVGVCVCVPVGVWMW
jgi:hypothetical protein